VQNVAPAINAFTVPGTAGVGDVVPITVAASDPAGAADPLTFAFATTASAATVTNNGDGTASLVFPDPGTFDVTATVTDDDGGSGTATAAITIDRLEADLRLSLSASTPSPLQGEEVDLVVTLTNDGPDPTDGVAVSAPLPAGLVVQSAGGATFDPGTGEWTVGAVGIGASPQLTLTARVDAGGPFTVTAEVIASSAEDPDSTPGNDDPVEDDRSQITLDVLLPCPDDLQISAYTVTGDTDERIEVQNTGSQGVSLAECSVVGFDALSEQSYFATDLSGTLDPGATYALGADGQSGLDQTFPGGTLQDGPDAIVLYSAPASTFPAGTPVTAALDDIVSSIVYFNNDAAFGCSNASASQCPPALAAKTNASGRSAGTDEKRLLLSMGDLVPDRFSLEQSFPNPVRGTATIRFGLAEEADVSLVVYDVLGREVARLLDRSMQAGTHEVRWNADRLSSGVYFYRMRAGDFVKTLPARVVR
jgi:uncharacterized repeat protein (TIGR01451 family)